MSQEEYMKNDQTLTPEQEATIANARHIIAAKKDRAMEPPECLAEIVDVHLAALRPIRGVGMGRLVIELTSIRSKLDVPPTTE